MTDPHNQPKPSFRPLDRVGSIKLKLGVAIVIAVGVSSVVSMVGFRLGWPIWVRPVVSATIALVLVQILARGMTSPLREMANAARRMADGDWTQRVTDTSKDEVGELARAFNDMARDLAAVDETRKDLVANVSHELRTPISALHARLENLVDGVDEPSPELLRSMLSQTARLGRLIDQLLDLSRLESGAVPLHLERIEVDTLLESVADEAALHAPERTITVDCAEGTHAVADPDRLHQVLANLVTNALTHAPDSPVHLAASAGPDNVLILSVRDEGPGVAQPDKVFDRFHREDAARSTRAGGAGLGLAIAQWIVDLHGGQITVENTTPVGCKVVVRLPAGEA